MRVTDKRLAELLAEYEKHKSNPRRVACCVSILSQHYYYAGQPDECAKWQAVSREVTEALGLTASVAAAEQSMHEWLAARGGVR